MINAYPVCLDERSRELSVDYEKWKFDTVRSHSPVGDLPFVVTSHTSVGDILLVVGVRVVLLSQTPRTSLRQGSIYPSWEVWVIKRTPSAETWIMRLVQS